MNYEEFKLLRSEGKIKAGISTTNAIKVSEALPKRYQRANTFWASVWMLSIPVFILISIFYSWKVGLPLLFILTPLLASATKKSCAQFVLEHAEEEKRFFDFLLEHDLLIFERISKK